MAGILFEDIFDVKDIDPEGKKFDRGEWGPRAASPPARPWAAPRRTPSGPAPPPAGAARRCSPAGSCAVSHPGLPPSPVPVPPLPFPPAEAAVPRPFAIVWHRPHRVLPFPGSPCFPSPASVPLHATPDRRYVPFPTPPCPSRFPCVPQSAPRFW